MNKPCNPDHNGECLVCDCWLMDCAWERLWDGDFTHETLDELLKMFKDHLSDNDRSELVDLYKV